MTVANCGTPDPRQLPILLRHSAGVSIGMRHRNADTTTLVSATIRTLLPALAPRGIDLGGDLGFGERRAQPLQAIHGGKKPIEGSLPDRFLEHDFERLALE